MTTFELGWILLLLKNYLQLANYISLPDLIDDALSLIVLAIFVCSILKKRYQIKELIIYIILAGMASYTGYITGYMVLTTSVLSIIAVKGENIYSIAKKTFVVQLSLLIFNTILSIMLYLVGMESGYLWYYSENQTRLRVCLGYGMAGHLADCILNIMLIWIFIHYRHISIKNYIVMILLSIISYIITDSRVVFFVSLFVIVMTYISKKGKQWEKIIRFFTGIIVPFCTMFMLFSIKQYEVGNQFGYLMDKILNSRVRNCGYNLEVHGVTFWGQNCYNTFDGSFNDLNYKWFSKGVAYDNLYMWFIINLGVIWLILMAIVMLVAAKKSSVFVCVMMISWALGAMVDTDFINGTRCISVLLLGTAYGVQNVDKMKSKNMFSKECLKQKMQSIITQMV